MKTKGKYKERKKESNGGPYQYNFVTILKYQLADQKQLQNNMIEKCFEVDRSSRERIISSSPT